MKFNLFLNFNLNVFLRLWSLYRKNVIVVKPGDRTTSSSVWPTLHPPSEHLRCGTTLCVVSTRDPLQPPLQSNCSVPAVWRLTDTSSCSSRARTMHTSVNWWSTFTVSSFTDTAYDYFSVNCNTVHSKKSNK